MLVATAAPATPSSGNGPSPKMKQGPSTMFSRLPSHNTRIAIAASPDPRNTALIRNNSTTVTLPPSMTWVNRCPERITSGDAPITCNRLGRARRRENGDQRRDDDPEQDRLSGRARRAVGVLLADATRHERHRADRQTHRGRVDHHQHRLGQTNRGDGIGAEMCDPEHVRDGKDRLHRHLHHHRDREHDHRTPDGRRRVVDGRSANRLAERRPDAGVPGRGRRRGGRRRGGFERQRHVSHHQRRSALNASGGADRSRKTKRKPGSGCPGTGRLELEAVRCDEQEEPGRNGGANFHRLLRRMNRVARHGGRWSSSGLAVGTTRSSA